MATLADIKIKVRRLTKAPSSSQLTDSQLEEYINNFILYDIPRHIQLFTFRETLTFYLMPYVSSYSTNTTNPLDPLYDFKNRYTTVHPPVYISGNRVTFSQSRSEFYNRVNKVNYINTIATGDGLTTIYNGTLTDYPVTKGQVIFSSVDAAHNGIVLKDRPIDDTKGDLIDVSNGIVSGSIRYVTGVYSLNFTVPPASGEPIKSQTIPYVPGRPTDVLYFDNTFTVSPIPDQPYTLNIEAYRVPSSMDDDAQLPELNQMWEYIAYGAARKVLEDRLDTDSLQIIMPLFNEQERLVLRRTLVQQSNERVSTIYQGGGNNNFQGGYFNGVR